MSPPTRPTKRPCSHPQTLSPLNLNPLFSISAHSPGIPPLSSPLSPLSQTSVHSIKASNCQTTLHEFFHLPQRRAHPPPKAKTPKPTPLPGHPSSRSMKRNLRHLLTFYSLLKGQSYSTHYTAPLSSSNLHDSWGHSLAEVDPSSTFRIFLQNPNGLNLFPIMFPFKRIFKYAKTMVQPSLLCQKRNPTGMSQNKLAVYAASYEEIGPTLFFNTLNPQKLSVPKSNLGEQLQ